MKVLTLVKKIQALAPLLPDSVAEASEDDNELHRVLTETSGIEDSPGGTLAGCPVGNSIRHGYPREWPSQVYSPR
jgi:hypothetical protein